MKNLLSIIAIGFCSTAYAQNYTAISPRDSKQEIVNKAAHITPSPRQLRWQQLEFTAFFHFGMNTFTNQEWGNGKEDPKLFNPTQLNASQWVRTSKQAGIKQVIITAKHHDGFCLWPSKYTEHSVKNSPWKNGQGDVVKEVAEACHAQGVGFGIYLSPWDRNNPDYGDTEKYNAYFMNQLTELLSNYGRVDEVWFDGANGESPNGKKPVYHFEEWYSLIRKLQPGAVIAIMGPDVRWVGTESGYGRLSEWSVVPIDKQANASTAQNSQKDIAFAPKGDMTGDDLGSRDKIGNAQALAWYPAETDVSIRPGWFYHEAEDDKVKSPEKLLDIYYSSVGRNSVLLLNIPPDKRGLINEHDQKNILEWKNIINRTFKNNLVKGARISSENGINTAALAKGSLDNYWTTKGRDTSSVIQITLSKPQTFDVLCLKENITIGQRIEKFSFEYFNGTNWEQAAEGTTVGAKRLIRFNAITAQKVRLKILASRLNPTLTTLGLYKQFTGN
ncbi:alpha-L-fucosidase [Mucilaginibacter gossypiicola]|uniref:alpha-L-fucosidase n=1 Tax=Mucilaginibacter gossypiicola TaxID=551995 RepID=A0A1H8BK71_9SPHI|nr:alpha-L-fucosidase [Mucilaginibacter gossypiicola]SEM82544.1 alpha-L-fucosidase [Mucilaginibacter gossypiicola]